MSTQLNFDGYWEGIAEYSCDNCGKTVKFRFDDEESGKDYKGRRTQLKEKFGWQFTKVNDIWVEFCSETCRNSYIRKNTFGGK